jgi:hypothetical protein
VLRVKPVSVCVTVTVTPGRSAPLSSVTRPFSAAVACADITPVNTAAQIQTTRETTFFGTWRIADSSLAVCEERYR